jgi:hypothetical protein
MRRQLVSEFVGTEQGSIPDMPNMKYFPVRNAIYIKNISGNRKHEKDYMVHRDGPPNLPSPPFYISMVTPAGSPYSLVTLKARKPPGHKHTNTQTPVSPPSCLCVLVAP